MNTLIAKKVGMTQVFDENASALGVTVLDVSNCRIVQIKSQDKDGYDAVQLTIGTAKNVNKPINEHYKKYNVEPGQGLYEVPTEPDSGLESGMKINVSDFFEVGQKMAGRMGNEKKTIQSVTVVGINEEKNYLLVNGSVPGKKGNVVQIKAAVKLQSNDSGSVTSGKIIERSQSQMGVSEEE